MRIMPTLISMMSLIPITLQHAIQCQKSTGFGRAIALFVFEDQTCHSIFNSHSESVLSCIAEWVNPDRWNKSGRCRFNLTLT
jgi:hypothetical protein